MTLPRGGRFTGKTSGVQSLDPAGKSRLSACLPGNNFNFHLCHLSLFPEAENPPILRANHHATRRNGWRRGQRCARFKVPHLFPDARSSTRNGHRSNLYRPGRLRWREMIPREPGSRTSRLPCPSSRSGSGPACRGRPAPYGLRSLPPRNRTGTRWNTAIQSAFDAHPRRPLRC